LTEKTHLVIIEYNISKCKAMALLAIADSAINIIRGKGVDKSRNLPD